MVATWGGYDINTGRNKKKRAQERARRWAEIGNWESQHSINPETGALEGPGGVVPGEVSLKWQQMHEQAVYNYRQRLMGGAQDYLQGAAGNLQRFRPGGAAAIESGIYSQMGQQQMQQAQMTEPLNLMRDYERMQAEKAAKDAKKASQLSAIAQIGSALGAVALTAATGGAAAPMAGALMAGGAAAGTSMGGSQPLTSSQAPGAQIGPDNEILSPNYMAKTGGPGMQSGPSYYQQGQGDGGGLSGSDIQGGQMLAGGHQMQGGGYQSGGPQMQQARQAGGPQMQQQGQRGGMQMQASPQQMMNQEIADHYSLGMLIDKYENDPDYMMIRDSIRTEAMLRSYGSLA